jgi:hypothetical protein
MPFSQKTRCVRSVIYISRVHRENFWFIVRRSCGIIFCAFVYLDVALLCCVCIICLWTRCAQNVYMCRKWVRFDETVTILYTVWPVSGEKRDGGQYVYVCMYIYIYAIQQQSDWSDFILHFSCIRMEPTRIPNDCKRSGLQLLLYIIRIHIVTVYIYLRQFECIQKSQFYGLLLYSD